MNKTNQNMNDNEDGGLKINFMNRFQIEIDYGPV